MLLRRQVGRLEQMWMGNDPLAAAIRKPSSRKTQGTVNSSRGLHGQIGLLKERLGAIEREVAARKARRSGASDGLGSHRQSNQEEEESADVDLL